MSKSIAVNLKKSPSGGVSPDRFRPPKSPISSGKSANNIKTKSDPNTSVSSFELNQSDLSGISQQNFECELSDLLKSLNCPSREVEVLRRSIVKMYKENQAYSSTSSTRRSSGSNESELKARIFNLEKEKAYYEEKIRNDANYIYDLQTKMGLLLSDYQKISKEEEASDQNSKQVKLECEKLDSLIENEQSLFEENQKLKDEAKRLSECLVYSQQEVQDLKRIQQDLINENNFLNDKLLKNDLSDKSFVVNEEMRMKWDLERNQLIKEIFRLSDLTSKFQENEEKTKRLYEGTKDKIIKDYEDKIHVLRLKIESLENKISESNREKEESSGRFEDYDEEISSLKETLAEKDQKFSLLQARYQNLERDMHNRSSNLENLVQSHLDVISELETTVSHLRKENELLRAENSEFEKNKYESEKSILICEKENLTLREDIQNLEKKLSAAEQEKKDLEKKLSAAEHEKKELEQKLSAAEQEKKDLQNSTQEFEKDKKKLEEQIGLLGHQISNFNKEMLGLEENNLLLAQNHSILESKLREQTEEVSKLENSNLEMGKRISELENQNLVQQEKIVKQQNEVENYKKKLDQMTGKYNELANLQSAENKLTEVLPLGAKNENYKNIQAENSVLKSENKIQKENSTLIPKSLLNNQGSESAEKQEDRKNLTPTKTFNSNSKDKELKDSDSTKGDADAYKLYGSEIEKLVSGSESQNNPELKKIKDKYQEMKLHVMHIDYIVENNKKLI